MASRKFKKGWIPTPLEVPLDVVVKRKDEPPPPLTPVGRIFVVAWFLVVTLFRASAVRLFPALGRGRYSMSESGRYTREFAERMGGMWVMTARLASMRTDLLGEAFCRELSMTRDRARPVPLNVIRQVIHEELLKHGTTIDEVLSEIDERPLNTRTFCQFHKARLKASGRYVVVRARPPGAAERVRIDEAYLTFFFELLQRIGYQVHMRWMDLLFEAKKAAEDQLDSRAEETELRHIAKILRPRRIYVPRVYRRYTGEGLIMTEFIEGVNVADIGVALRRDRDQTDLWMRKNHINPRRVSQRILNAHLELLFEHDLFYTELLPRNIILLRNNRFAFVSLNTVETLDGSLLRKYRLLFRSLMVKDYTKVCDTFLALGPPLPRKDLNVMRSAVKRSLRTWDMRTHIKSAPYAEKSLTAAMQRLSVCAGQFSLPATWSLTRLHFGERVLDESLETLNPGLNFTKALHRYNITAQLRTIQSAMSKNVAKESQGFADSLQANAQLMENFEFDSDYLRGRLINFGGAVSRAGKIARRIVTLLSRVAVAVMTLQVFMYIKRRYNLDLGPDEGVFARALDLLPVKSRWTWLILLGVLLYLWSILRGLRKQLSKEDIRPIA